MCEIVGCDLGIQAQGSSGCLKGRVVFHFFSYGFDEILYVISRFGLVVEEERLNVHVAFVPDGCYRRAGKDTM
jgi:hypothetical protein